MSKLHDAFPKSPIMFTEGSKWGLSGANDIIDILRNWATTYTAWVTMLDSNGKPNAGPYHAGQTMVELVKALWRSDAAVDYFIVLSGFVTHWASRGAFATLQRHRDDAARCAPPPGASACASRCSSSAVAAPLAAGSRRAARYAPNASSLRWRARSASV